eukprot:TRINITY_DN10976_c0_g1_i1.p1 TRINITY_DN10976_c0_g1~~TRINITY_DN10976_c0_g1_i1.p1  ORF type:complete len:344 (-),score=45.36 TRINITY_DN10976_c0_g1_i1:1-1032(-)
MATTAAGTEQVSEEERTAPGNDSTGTALATTLPQPASSLAAAQGQAALNGESPVIVTLSVPEEFPNVFVLPGEDGVILAVQEENDASGNGSMVTLGIPLVDTVAKATTIRVIVLAAFACAFHMVLFIFNLLRGSYDSSRSGNVSENSVWAAFSSLLIELSIPMSGYMGAIYHNRQLACCFCSCNLFMSIVSVTTFVRVCIQIAEINGDCMNASDLEQQSLCQTWVTHSVERYVLFGNVAMTTMLGCVSFWTGNVLYNKLANDYSVAPRTLRPIVGEVIRLTATSPGAGAFQALPASSVPASSGPSPAEPEAAMNGISVSTNAVSEQQAAVTAAVVATSVIVST